MLYFPLSLFHIFKNLLLADLHFILFCSLFPISFLSTTVINEFLSSFTFLLRFLASFQSFIHFSFHIARFIYILLRRVLLSHSILASVNSLIIYTNLLLSLFYALFSPHLFYLAALCLSFLPRLLFLPCFINKLLTLLFTTPTYPLFILPSCPSVPFFLYPVLFAYFLSFSFFLSLFRWTELVADPRETCTKRDNLHTTTIKQ